MMPPNMNGPGGMPGPGPGPGGPGMNMPPPNMPPPGSLPPTNIPPPGPMGVPGSGSGPGPGPGGNMDFSGEIWVETKASEGKSYFYNARTRETTWTKPEGNVKILLQEQVTTLKE